MTEQERNERVPSDDPQLTIDHVNPHDDVISRDGDDILRNLTDVKPKRPTAPVSMEDQRTEIRPSQKP
jgi:hypothetical protein